MNAENNSELKDKRTYELALLLPNEEALPRAMELVRQHNGELLAEPRAKKLALAYEIKGMTEGVFVSLTFRATGEDAKNLERDLQRKQEVLRSMLLVSPPQAERQVSAPPYPASKRGRPAASPRMPAAYEPKPAAPQPLSNEALEKKIEEILG